MKKELTKGEIKMFEKLKKIKENKVLKFIGNVLYTIMFILVVLMLLVVVMQRVTNNNIAIGGIRMFSVATGSMIPVYEVGDILISKEIEPEKIILAVPFYTRVWTTNSEGKIVSNNTVAMKNIDKVIPDGVNKKWDNELKQNYVEYTDGKNKKQMWMEDIDSLKAKVSLITEHNLAGVGSWEKDMESAEVWKMLKDELNK